MSALVSILIPAYNAETTIADTLDSAVSQTWPDKEIIVVDDGSTDRTVAVARRYAARNVTVVSRENQGAAASRNAAFSLCNGDYIQWLDADDLLSSNKIESQMLARTSGCTPRTLLSAAWGYFMHRPHRATFTPTSLWCDLTPTEWLFRKMGQNLHMQTATWLVSRALTEAAGPWNTQLLGDDDGEYFCRVLMASDGVRFVPEARVFYRRSGSSRLSYIGHSDRKIYAHFHSMKLHIDYLLSLEDSARSRTAGSQPGRSPDSAGPVLEVRLGPFVVRVDIRQANAGAAPPAEVVCIQASGPRAVAAGWAGSWHLIRHLWSARVASPRPPRSFAACRRPCCSFRTTRPIHDRVELRRRSPAKACSSTSYASAETASVCVKRSTAFPSYGSR
jgi:glycosyltransferase involved in cell wall biosynthesis